MENRNNAGNARTIDLTDIIGDRIDTRHLVGSNLRKKLNLNTKDSSDKVYVIVLPQSMKDLSISFFIGLFGISVLCLGRHKFTEKYKFTSDGDKLSNHIAYNIKLGTEWASGMMMK